MVQIVRQRDIVRFLSGLGVKQPSRSFFFSPSSSCLCNTYRHARNPTRRGSTELHMWPGFAPSRADADNFLVASPSLTWSSMANERDQGGKRLSRDSRPGGEGAQVVYIIQTEGEKAQLQPVWLERRLRPVAAWAAGFLLLHAALWRVDLRRLTSRIAKHDRPTSQSFV